MLFHVGVATYSKPGDIVHRLLDTVCKNVAALAEAVTELNSKRLAFSDLILRGTLLLLEAR